MSNYVCCDGCYDDYTNSNESGGLIICNRAYCPKCAPSVLEGAKQYNEEHYCKLCPEGLSFKEFVDLHNESLNNLKKLRVSDFKVVDFF